MMPGAMEDQIGLVELLARMEELIIATKIGMLVGPVKTKTISKRREVGEIEKRSCL